MRRFGAAGCLPWTAAIATTGRDNSRDLKRSKLTRLLPLGREASPAWWSPKGLECESVLGQTSVPYPHGVAQCVQNRLPGHPLPAATSSEPSGKRRRMVARPSATLVVAVGRLLGRPPRPAEARAIAPDAQLCLSSQVSMIRSSWRISGRSSRTRCAQGFGHDNVFPACRAAVSCSVQCFNFGGVSGTSGHEKAGSPSSDAMVCPRHPPGSGVGWPAAKMLHHIPGAASMRHVAAFRPPGTARGTPWISALSL